MKTNFSVTMDVETAIALRDYCRKTGKKRSQVIEKAVASMLEKEDSK